MEYFVQQLVNGLSVGAILALIAVGYTMVYGILKLINFAHGDVFMVGAMVAYYLATWTGLYTGYAADGPIDRGGALPFLLVIGVSAVVCAVLGFLIEFLAYRPLRSRPRLTVLITAIGVSLFLEYGGQQLFGATPKSFPQIWPALSTGGLTIRGVVLPTVDLVVLALTLILMAGLSFVVLKTRPGLALRAASFRFDTAALMGINVDRVVSFTFILGSALAAVGGVLYAVKFPSIDPLMGLFPGIKAFVAAVLGGIGNIAGAVVGALVLGLTETLVVGYVPGGSQYRDAVAFVILIGILLVKPSGIFGSRAVEKV